MGIGGGGTIRFNLKHYLNFDEVVYGEKNSCTRSSQQISLHYECSLTVLSCIGFVYRREIGLLKNMEELFIAVSKAFTLQ